MRNEVNPTAFVSWAHRQSGWTDEEAAAWEADVVAFTALLRACGIDADVDAFHYHDSDIDWTRYGPSQIREREFTLVVLSEGWRERWEGTNEATEGAGAVAEANALLGLFNENQDFFRHKVKLVLLPGVPNSAVPKDLHGVPRFRITDLSANRLEDLVRTLTEQPLYEARPLGQIPIFPRASAASRVDEAIETPGRVSDDDLDRQLAKIDEEIGVLKAALARLPEPQPWEGPQLPWWRAWHQNQGRLSDLEHQRLQLRRSQTNAVRVVRRARTEIDSAFASFGPALPNEAKAGYEDAAAQLREAEQKLSGGDVRSATTAIDAARRKLKELEMPGIFQPAELNYARVDALRLLDGLA